MIHQCFSSVEESIYTRSIIIYFSAYSCSLNIVQYVDLYLLEDSKGCIRVLLGFVEEGGYIFVGMVSILGRAVISVPCVLRS